MLRPLAELSSNMEEFSQGSLEVQVRVHSEDEIGRFMEETYLTSREKIDLSIEIAGRERELLKNIDYENGYSLYVGIPCCPTTCLYLSLIHI